MRPLSALALSLISLISVIGTASATIGYTLVNLRIEGRDRTIYEAPIPTKGRNVTTQSGGTHPCNGLNNNANPTAGPTCTSALADASALAGFTFDGDWDPSFEDFLITRIAHSQQTSTEFWGLLLDFAFTNVGGCQQEVTFGQDVLWAFDAFNKTYFLKLVASSYFAHVGQPYTVTVTDGPTGVPIAGATVGGAITNSAGVGTLTFTSIGVKVLKAEAPVSLRSNAIYVVVLL